MEGKEAVGGCKERDLGLKELKATARRFLYQRNLDCLPRYPLPMLCTRKAKAGVLKSVRPMACSRAKPKQAGKQ